MYVIHLVDLWLTKLDYSSSRYFSLLSMSIFKATEQLTTTEFNVYADTLAAARLFALTSSSPPTTNPPSPPTSSLKPPPKTLKNPLNLVLYPLDVTTNHNLDQPTVHSLLDPLTAGTTPSPIAGWVTAFLDSTFGKLDRLYGPGTSLSLHDPCCILHLIADLPLSPKPIDVRIETGGQWTKGACVVDRRGRSLDELESVLTATLESSSKLPQEAEDVEIDKAELHGESADEGSWLGDKGNKVWIPASTGWEEKFGSEMLRMIFSL
jgi:hypothetical protein